MIDFKELVGDKKNPKFKSCYMLFGEEPFFIDKAIEYFEDEVIKEEESAFNRTVVYGKDAKLDAILEVARRFPMMAERQVVIVKEAQELQDWRKKDRVELLEHYIDHPVESTVLVFAFKGKKPDGRMGAVKKVKKAGALIEYKKKSERQLPDWIISYAQKQGASGYSIDQNAALLMAEYLGSDLKKVTNAIDKMKILLPEGSTITIQHIQDNVGISKDFNVFEFQKALSHKDVLKSYQIGHYFASNPKANPIQMVLPLLYSHFSKAMIYQTLGGGINRFDAAKKIGASPYAVDDIAGTAQRFNRTKLARIIGYLRESDQRSKGVDNVSLDIESIYKELIFKILH